MNLCVLPTLFVIFKKPPVSIFHNASTGLLPSLLDHLEERCVLRHIVGGRGGVAVGGAAADAVTRSGAGDEPS